MRRNTLNFGLDALSLLAMLALAGTGLLMKFTLPPGSGGKSVWGLGRHAWGDVHFWVAATLLALLVLHIALHWGWVYATTRRVSTHRTHAPRQPHRERAVGFVFLGAIIVLLAGFLAIAERSTVAPSGGAEAGGTEHGTEPH